MQGRSYAVLAVQLPHGHLWVGLWSALLIGCLAWYTSNLQGVFSAVRRPPTRPTMFNSQPCIAAKQAVQHQTDGGCGTNSAWLKLDFLTGPCLAWIFVCFSPSSFLVKAGSTPALGITMEAGFSI